VSGPTFKLVVPARFAGGFLEAIARFADEERRGKRTKTGDYAGIVRLDSALKHLRQRASLGVGPRRYPAIEESLTAQLAGDLFAFSFWIRNNANGGVHGQPDWDAYIDDLRVALRAWLDLSIIEHIGKIEP